MHPVNCICYSFSCQVLSLIFTSFVRTFLCVKQNIEQRGIRTPQSSESKSDALFVVQCGHVSCQLYVTYSAAKCCPFVDSIFKKFPLCQAKSRRQRDSNPQSSDSKSDALSVGPYGHVSCQSYLFSCHMLSRCIDSISKKFTLCQAKSRRLRDSNPQVSDSKSDALSVGPCGLVSCQLYLLLVQLPSVVPCNDSISKNFFCVKQKVDLRGIRTPNLLIRSQTPYPLGHASCQLYLLLVQCSVAKCCPL